MTPVPATPTSPPTEAVEAAMSVLLCKRQPVFNRCVVHEFRTWDGGWTEQGCPVAVSVAAAVVAALDLPGREREAAAKALDDAADKVQWVYDLQCPPKRSDFKREFGRGAFCAHQWWSTVLGGELGRLRARATALREGDNRG